MKTTMKRRLDPLRAASNVLERVQSSMRLAVHKGEGKIAFKSHKRGKTKVKVVGQWRIYAHDTRASLNPHDLDTYIKAFEDIAMAPQAICARLVTDLFYILQPSTHITVWVTVNGVVYEAKHVKCEETKFRSYPCDTMGVDVTALSGVTG